MNILGLYGYFGGNNPDRLWVHDAGASLFIDGKHICSIAEERLSREKHDGEYPYRSIKYVLKEANLREKDIDIVCFPKNMNTFQELHLATESFLNREFINAKINIIEHHIAHASAAFYTSPFEKASVYTQDGGGNMSSLIADARNTGTYGIGYKDKGIELVYDFINLIEDTTIFNLGQTYNHISLHILDSLGSLSVEELHHPATLESSAGKVMGLSAYGNAENIDNPDLFWIEYDGFNFPKIKSLKLHLLDIQYLARTKPQDLAAWLQKQFEDILIKYFTELKLKEDYLCIGGGCALNVLANRRLIQEGIFKDIHVFPGTNDSGLAFGGAIYEAARRESEIILPENLGLLGKTYSFEEIEDTINENFKV